tara:strand:- start:99 stop:1523 length:1425 start_codon:yes stop_codon:yes gene_type:complete
MSSSSSSCLILLYSILTIASASLQAVAFKNAGYALGPYPYFILLAVSFAFVPIFFIGVALIQKYGQILKAAQSFEYKKAFAVIGVLNGMNGILIIFSNPHVSGIAQSTLSQFVIPLTLTLSVVILRASFSKLMWFGAVIIMSGVMIELSPTFSSTAVINKTNNNGWWAVVFALGQLPAALCSIYQERAFTKGVRINVVYMMAWSSLAQFISLLFAAPLNFIPGFGNAGGSVNGFIENMKNATLCVSNTLPNHHSECSRAGLLLGCCILTMLLTNVFQALLVKHSSASLSVLVLTMITPASTFCFTLPFLMGKDTEVMSILEWVALGILMIGVVIYRYADVLERKIGNGSDGSGGGDISGSLDMNSDNDLNENGSSRSRSSSIQRHSSRPLLMSTRSGIINSEYTGGDGNHHTRSISILMEGTVFESRIMAEAHASAPLISRSLPTESTQRSRLVKSARKPPRLGTSASGHRNFV